MGQTKALPKITGAKAIARRGERVTVEVTTTDPKFPEYELDMTTVQYVRTLLEISHRGSAPIPTGENA